LDSSLNLVFCGTPAFAVPSLEKLVKEGFRVSLVVTQPDRPRGRGMELALSPVKQSASRLNLPVMQPEKIKNNQEFQNALGALRPDAIIVVGYGRIIPQWMIDLPRLGNINVHASLLPKYRGAAPIQWAIARGETVTGVTTMKIDAGLDTGDMLLQAEMKIEPDDTAETIGPRLAAMGGDLLVETLRGLEAATVRPQKQDDAKATLAPILKKEDGRMNFSLTASEIGNRLRGLQPWPGAFTIFRGKNLNIWKSAAHGCSIPPGEMVIEDGRMFAGCASNTAVEFIEVQPEGKKRMTARDFVHGYHPRPGEKLGE
jgi:methionyl-tRNA formyltransferase